MTTKPRHVLALVDFSEASDEALRQAHGYARMVSAKLSVLHVVPDFLPASPLLPDGSVKNIDAEVQLEARALDELGARVKEITGRSRNDADVAVAMGSADAAAVHHAEQHHVDLVVVGATGRTGLARLLMGSTAERIVRHAPCSVLVARPSPASNHLLAATDLSDAATPAVERAKAEAEWRGGALHLVHAMDFSALGWTAAAGPLGGFGVAMPPERMAQMRKLAEEALRDLGGPAATVHVVEGSAKRAVVSLAESLPAGLVIVGTHGRTGLRRMALGSVAEAIARVAPCSVLVVRKEETKEKPPTGNFEG
jgi:nucleotide-binding universal stress UspA family protein